jgi:hypothetical protein
MNYQLMSAEFEIKRLNKIIDHNRKVVRTVYTQLDNAIHEEFTSKISIDDLKRIRSQLKHLI